MKKVAYLECPTGIAGDMLLGALVDVGVPLDYLKEQLAKLGMEQEYHLHATKVHRQGQIATQVTVELNSVHSSHSHSHSHLHSAPTRHLPEIESLIQAAPLPPRASAWSLQVFRQLAKAEAAVHGISVEKVHFHEVGATDAIVDIVGSCLGLDWLNIEQLDCSSFPVGGGTVKAAHGELPVPAPAVLKLWEMYQVPVYSNGITKELVTPTGAALACTLATNFGPPPTMTLEKVGLGAGSRSLPIPNILRLWIGNVSLTTDGDTVVVLETQIDDSTPQAISYTLNSLLKAGAVDVFTQAVAMKKSRLGTLLTVICPPEKVTICEQILFQETTTLGIRRLTQQRTILQREIQSVETPYGSVRVKVATQGTRDAKKIMNVQPEYEDCALLAQKYAQPWQVIHQKALEAWEHEK